MKNVMKRVALAFSSIGRVPSTSLLQFAENFEFHFENINIIEQIVTNIESKLGPLIKTYLLKVFHK